MTAMDYSKIADLYDLYVQTKIMFYLHSKESFESLASAQGYRIVSLYGDYERAAFQPQTSPFMIWVLRKTGELEKGI
jgi:hypothetical protein